MTTGQQLALQQLQEIQGADQHAFEVVVHRPPTEADKRLFVEVSLCCDSLTTAPGGLPLRARESFIIAIPPDFPFTRPSVWTTHGRFAGWPHVFWKQSLCLYQAPATEWDPADGIFGFVDRLWMWLKHGALSDLNPLGQPLHPPYTGTTSRFVLVPEVNTPRFDGPWWVGFATLHAVGDRRFDVESWHGLSAEPPPATGRTPVVLLSRDLPWEMPGKLSDLLRYFEAAGMPRVAFFALLRLCVLQTPTGEPLLFILGTPQRGIAGTAHRLQHLMAWEVGPLLVDALRISLRQYSDYPPLREIGEEGERLALEIAEKAEILWCRVMENRPEVTIRRDTKTPISVFQGRSACLWGCGALGSHVAYFLAKAGVQRLVLLDQGVVTPGLLVRQIYEDAEVGQAKAEALSARLAKLRPDLVVEAFTHDLLQDLQQGADWTRGADFVMDCTASHTLQAKLELALRLTPPRRAPLISMVVGPRAERGILVVVPPTHKGGVKDVFRKAKIAACRGADLLSFADDFYPKGDKLEFFQPEPGCSDATFIGAVTDVCALSASMLNLAARELAGPVAEAAAFFVTQPLVVFGQPNERLVVRKSWPSDMVVGTSYEVRLSPAAWKDMTAEIRCSRRTRGRSVETGGILFGKRDDTLRIIWVDSASGPPADSKHSAAEFVCGVEGVVQMEEAWKRETRGSIEYVGVWHTHPEDAPRPSPRDLFGMVKILTVGDPPPRKSLLLIAGLSSVAPWLGAAVFERRSISDGWQVIEASSEMKALNGVRV